MNLRYVFCVTFNLIGCHSLKTGWTAKYYILDVLQHISGRNILNINTHKTKSTDKDNNI